MVEIKPKICPICNNDANYRLTKKNINYWQCEWCKHLFSDPIDQDGKVGGENHQERNDLQNHIRIGRIAQMMTGVSKKEYNILDFGAGFGVLMNAFRENGYNCDAYDAFNEEFSKLPERNKYHAVTMVETIEHLSGNFIELDVINRSMVLGGGIMIETSFVDVAKEDGIPLEDFFYIAPQSGHSTIFSHWSLDLLMSYKGFVPKKHFNRNVRNYIKIKSLP